MGMLMAVMMATAGVRHHLRAGRVSAHLLISASGFTRMHDTGTV